MENQSSISGDIILSSLKLISYITSYLSNGIHGIVTKTVHKTLPGGGWVWDSGGGGDLGCVGSV